MFKNFKTRIAIWYAALFAIIISSTLFASYKIISYQLINDIKTDLETKANLVNQTLTGEHRQEESEHSDEEREEHGFIEDKTQVSRILNLDFTQIRMYTEVTNPNYALFVFSENDLIYITPKYKRLSSHVANSIFTGEQFYEVSIEGVPFGISTLSKAGNSIHIGYEVSTVKNLQRRLVNIFLIVFPLSLLLSVLCGLVVTQKTLNVIERIDATAKKITSSNLGNRIELPKSNDEISRLIITLNSMIDRLEKSFTQAKQFSQDAAHEIRTPLTIIRGEIEEIIEREEGNDKAIKSLENILEEVQYLTSISERLLMIHNLDTNNIRYHFERVNLSELMKEIYQDVQVLSIDKNIKVELAVTDDIVVNGNKELLTQLFWNISDNAIKYNHPNGAVSIKLNQTTSEVIIDFRDSGIGIPQKDLTKIFDRFYRVDKSRSRHLGGSGLGLSICKWIAELHNGEIAVESEEGAGSTFTITIAKS